MTFQKNEITTVKIDDTGAEGEGIGRVDGFTLFVKDAVVGDLVEARIVKVKKKYAYARVEKVVTPSPFRVEPKCAYHRQCGGCQLQALSYDKQLQFKQDKIRNNLIRLGGFDKAVVDGKMEPIIGMEEPWHYRNKAQYPVGRDKEGNIVTGFYAGRTHSIIANTDCALGVAENREILEMILEYMKENKVSAYDETTGTGLVRHVLIRKGFTSGELMVCLVINRYMTDVLCKSFSKGRKDKTDKRNKREKTDKNGKEASQKGGKTVCVRYEARADGDKEWDGGEQYRNILPRQEELLRRLASVKGMTSVSVSFNKEQSNVIMGKEVYTIWGKDTISDTIHVRDMDKPGYPYTGKELGFYISPLSFYQVNPIQTEKLYSLALEYAGLTGQETVWDLYCGIGTISLFLAGSAKKVYGVEVIPQAIQDARENAKRNNIRNAEFFVGKAEEVLPAFYQQGEAELYEMSEGRGGADTAGSRDIAGEGDTADSGAQGGSAAMLRPDVIVVDPPRKGCDEACLATMLKMQPDRIVYVSCDSATLARDLKVLCEGGYKLCRIRGVDQFGMTVHVETIVLLSRKLSDSHINVKVGFGKGALGQNCRADETISARRKIR
ncbi:MAG: class I SAM-dependent RNA methyltransferase [Acetatifactor sp.]|nr:class I SAM-dependent RNA methyltransferase [Acetatifactor sp.]